MYILRPVRRTLPLGPFTVFLDYVGAVARHVSGTYDEWYRVPQSTLLIAVGFGKADAIVLQPLAEHSHHRIPKLNKWELSISEVCIRSRHRHTF